MSKETIPCKPDCPIDLDVCGQIHLLGGQFPCMIGSRIERLLTPEELEIFQRERQDLLQKLAEAKT